METHADVKGCREIGKLAVGNDDIRELRLVRSFLRQHAVLFLLFDDVHSRIGPLGGKHKAHVPWSRAEVHCGAAQRQQLVGPGQELGNLRSLASRSLGRKGSLARQTGVKLRMQPTPVHKGVAIGLALNDFFRRASMRSHQVGQEPGQLLGLAPSLLLPSVL